MIREGDVLWAPGPDALQRTNLGRFLAFVEERHGLGLRDYAALQRWSVTELEDFWAAVCCCSASCGPAWSSTTRCGAGSPGRCAGRCHRATCRTRIAAVPHIPRTRTGKKLEVPVKRILLGAPAGEVASRDALSEPAALDAYVAFGVQPPGSGRLTPLHWWTARALAAAIRGRELSAREVVAAHLDRIAAVNPCVNAVVSLRPEAALAEAEAADRRAARGEPLGPLHGLPIAIKDLQDTAGIRTTYGSRLYADHVPVADSLLAARLRAAGAIVVGKTNTPEFGAGSHTFNDVFGTTRNPWALDRSAGGSSGGAGAALASGMLPIADGSDHGGSIRNPAAFNDVVGLRPTPGLVPDAGGDDVWDVAAVAGPMARTVGDLALLLTAIAGPHPRAPLSHGDPAAFADEPRGDLAGLRVAWCPDVGGLPVEPAVLAVLAGARERFVDQGARVEDVDPDLDEADEAFETLRALGFARTFGADLERMRGTVKDTVIWNAEQVSGIDGAAVARAIGARSRVFRTIAGLLERFDVLVAPAAQVVPFRADLEYPREVAGVAMPHYLGWMRACSRITVSSHPVAAVPAGFTGDGLPVGLQLVGAFRGDRRLLEIAAAWEAATGLTERHPPLD